MCMFINEKSHCLEGSGRFHLTVASLSVTVSVPNKQLQDDHTMTMKLSQSQYDAVRVELQRRVAIEHATVAEIAATIPNSEHVGESTLWYWARQVERLHPYYTVMPDLEDKCASEDGCTTSEFIAIINEHYARIPEEQRPKLTSKYIKYMKNRARSNCVRRGREFNLVQEWMRGTVDEVAKRIDVLQEVSAELVPTVRKLIIKACKKHGAKLGSSSFTGFVNSILRSAFQVASPVKPSMMRAILSRKAITFALDRFRKLLRI